MKKRILSMLCSIAILCTLFTGVANAQEIDSDKKIVDGSYLTHEDSSTGTSVPKGARGEYLATGDCTISKAGLTRIYAYASTYSTKLYDKKTRVWYTKPMPKVYDTFIMINPKRKNVVLSCSCPDFLYRHEVALYRKGGAEITYSNGRLPKITNPKYRATCCKHCLAMYLYLSSVRPDVFEPDIDLNNAIG